MTGTTNTRSAVTFVAEKSFSLSLPLSYVIVVPTEERKSSSSLSDCILSSLVVRADPLVVSSTTSALLGRPSHDGV